MAFFEFPHTRIYDSDLGWLIRHVRDLINEYGSLERWRNVHETEYKELKSIVEGLQHSLIDVIVPWDSSIAYKIYTIVEYLGTNYIAIQDVPVGVMITNTNYWTPANTIVEQINAIGIETSTIRTRQNDELRSTMTGIYMGDFIVETVMPQGMVKANGKIYTLSTYDNEQNECLLRVFDLTTNAEVGTPKTIIGGHGNGLTYCPDNNSFYISPIWDRSGGSAQRWNVLIKYDSTFDNYTLVPMPVTNSMMATAYDYATNTLYALDYTRMIYTVDPFTDEVLPVESIAYAFDLDPDMLVFNQVFAIHDGAWCVSDPHNIIRCGHLGETWTKDYFVNHEDGGGNHLGEIEGMNFDEDNNLIAMFTTTLYDGFYCGVITELSADIPSNNGYIGQVSRAHYEFILSDATQAAFKNSITEIKSLRQLAMRTGSEATHVLVNGNVIEAGDSLRLTRPISMTIESGSTLQIGRIILYSSFFMLNGSGTLKNRTTAGAVLYSAMGSAIILSGSLTIDTEADTDIIRCGTSGNQPSDITILNLYTANHNLTMNGLPYKTGRYSNANRERPLQILTGNGTASIPANESHVDIDVTFDRPFETIPNVIAGIQSTSSVRNNVCIAVVYDSTTTGCRIRVWRQSEVPITQAINPLYRWIAISRN